MSQIDLRKVSKPLELLGEQQSAPVISPLTPHIKQASYHPVAWAWVNAILDVVDTLSGGRAGWLQRLFTYLLIGGFAALVNLSVFFVLLYHTPLPVNAAVHNVIASAFACEISLIANFIPNDYFTFRHLLGRHRSWAIRCARFHVVSLTGSILTLLIEFGFNSVIHIPALIAQATAIILVLFYNFSFHHIFTYRHVPTAG